MTINGKFGLASATNYRDGVVLVGFLGNAYPQKLTAKQIDYIKGLYNMTGSKHEICTEWPAGVKPYYPAAMSNFKNGYILLTKEVK